MPHDSGPTLGPIPKTPEELLRYGTRGHSLAAIAKLWGTTKQTVYNVLAGRSATADPVKLRARLNRLATQGANLAPLLPPIPAALLQQHAEILRNIAKSKELCGDAKATNEMFRHLVETTRCTIEESMLQMDETGMLIDRIREGRRSLVPFKMGPLPDAK